MARITPFLWFDNQALAAARFYCSIFPNSHIRGEEQFASSDMEQSSNVVIVEFDLDGSPFLALNGGPGREFNEAVSFVIDCSDQAEVDHYWNGLLANGGVELQCGWLRDQFGIPWQVVPKQLGILMSTGTPEQSTRVGQAMMGMVKLEVAGLEAAFHAGA